MFVLNLQKSVSLCVCTSVNAHHEPGEVSGALHAEGADEEVESRGDEDNDGRDVVQVVQTFLQGAVVQVPTACDTHTHTHTQNTPGGERKGSNYAPFWTH